MSRVRSPNYPAMSLPEAVDRIRTIHKAEGKNSMGRETIAKLLGFSGINGASATAISAIGKYGLLEVAGDGESRVSELAVNILYPDDSAEKQKSLAEAAFRPTLFREVREKWPDRPPSDENLRSYLVKKGFAQNALDGVIRIYRETIDNLGDATPGYNEPPSALERSMAPETTKHEMATMASPPPGVQLPDGRPFSVAFDGSLLSGVIAIRSAKEIDRLVRVLNAQKAAFEAMDDEASDSLAS